MGTLPNLPTNRPTPTTPLHPSVVKMLMLEATESLPDLFEPLPTRRPLYPTRRPLHRPRFLWKRDMASLGLLELLLLNEKCVMDSLGLGLPTLPPPTTLGLPTLPPPTLLRLHTRRTTPLLPLPMELIVANVKLLSMALPTRLVGLLWVTLAATTLPVPATSTPLAILGVMVPATSTPLPEGF